MLRNRMVRGEVEPPTFRFSGVADTQVPERLPCLGGDCRMLVEGIGCRRCRQRCRHICSVLLAACERRRYGHNQLGRVRVLAR